MEEMAYSIFGKTPKIRWLNKLFSPTGLLILILILSAFLRLYRISDYMTFLGDEGRDVLIVREILHGNFTLLGPRASAGDFFLGPIYYYFMAPFLLLFNYDPVGPAVMIALLGVATVYLVYRVGREFFGVRASLIAASLYAVSPLVIAYSRSSWNPNPMPFFSLLILYLLYKSILRPSLRVLFAIGVLIGITMQLHYLATFLIAISGVFYLVGKIYKDKKVAVKELSQHFVAVFGGFLVGLSPFLLFELRHGFPNIKTIISFIFADNFQAEYGDNFSFTAIVGNVFLRLFGRLIFSFPPPEQFKLYDPSLLFSWQVVVIIFLALSLLSLYLSKNKLASILLSLWLIIGVLLFGVYKKPIYDYYFGFMFPLPFLMIGNLLSMSFLQKWLSKLVPIGIIVFIAIFLFNLYSAPFRYQPNKQKDQIKGISEFVLSKTGRSPFNFALLTPGNSDHGYRYYFEINNRAPVVIENLTKDPKRESVTKQLMIVCEDLKCQPLGHPLFEVAGFGQAEIDGVWDLELVKVYRLIPFEEKDQN